MKLWGTLIAGRSVMTAPHVWIMGLMQYCQDQKELPNTPVRSSILY